MKSRERVVTVLNHEEADRVPIDFGAMRSTGINAIAYGKLKAHLGIKSGKTKIYDIWQQLAMPEPVVQERFRADVLQLCRNTPNWGISINEYKPGECTDGSLALVPKDLNPVVDEDGSKRIVRDDGVTLAKLPQNGLYYENMYHPMKDVEHTEEIDEKFSFTLISDRDLDIMETQAKYMYENTDKAILGEFIGTFYEQGQGDFGYENYYYNISAEKELVHHYNKKLLNHYLTTLEKYLKRVGKYLNVIHFGDDLGTQVSLQISIDMYREMIKPYARELYSYVRENYPHIKCFMHCCGSIAPLIPEFIEIGIEVLNPVQLTARGMDPVMLKETFGDKISFWGGGINLSTTATTGTAEQVEEEVRYLMNIFKKNGGFVWNHVHNIQADVPPENVVAMYDAAYKYGKFQ